MHCLESAPYENYSLFHPDGTLMCFCSAKRANWYLQRGLAEQIGPKSFGLTFEPRGYGDPNVILGNRENICVITGESNNLTKHHVVPTQFRKLFPNAYKDKNSMDLLLLTREAHNDYEQHATLFKHILYADFDFRRNSDKYREWREITKYVNALINHKHQIPPSIQVYMQMRIDGIRDRWNFTDAELQRGMESILFPDPIEQVINYLGVENMIVIWKLHFIKYGKPKFLPDWWKPNLIKIVTRGINPVKNDVISIDLNQPKLVELLKKYELYETAQLYI